MEQGRNIPYSVRKVPKAIYEVEPWALMWGFRFSVAKTQCSLPGVRIPQGMLEVIWEKLGEVGGLQVPSGVL